MDTACHDITRKIKVKDLMERFRDAERFIAYCRECPGYGRRWGCPPFDFDADSYLAQWDEAEITATVIPVPGGTPIAEAHRLLTPERLRLDAALSAREKATGGVGFSFVGNCLYCPEGDCTRPLGLPCRHPGKVRPSLEAFGFDIEAILSRLFNLKLLWGANGELPSYLTLVTAFFRK